MKGLLLFVALWTCSACQAADYFGERYLFDIAHPGVKADQRIVSFKISLKGAKLDSIDPVPAGWSLSIKNGSDGTATMAGEIDAGIAAVSVQGFVKTISLRKYLADEKDFAITGELVLLGGYEDARDATVKLETRNIRLVKAKQ